MLTRLEFLRAVLPTAGLLFSATPRPSGRGYTHRAHETVDALDATFGLLDGRGLTCYAALASFRAEFVKVERRGEEIEAQRVHENVRFVRSFWLDLDVEPGAPGKFASRAGALGALESFAAEVGLPAPLVNESGPAGLHVYWPFAEHVERLRWKRGALVLKGLCAKLSLFADPSRTSDESSVLRPPGTHHRKGEPYLIENLDAGAGPRPFDELVALLERAARRLKVDVAEGRAPVSTGSGTDLNAGADFDDIPSDPDRVADACKQIALFRSQAPERRIPEPVWYHGIQLLLHTVGGEAKIHEWSAGDPRYDRRETERKADQLRSVGPTLCSKFADVNPSGCDGCAYRGKIPTPVRLGWSEIPKRPAPVLEVAPGELARVEVNLYPFERTEHGVFIALADGTRERVLAGDLYVEAETYDAPVDTRTIRVVYELKSKRVVADVASALLAAPAEFHKAMLNAGITFGAPQLKGVIAYMTKWLDTIRQNAAERRLTDALGWRDGGFQLGDRLYTPRGVASAGISSAVSDLASAFETRGDAATWTGATALLAGETFRPHLFTLAAAFGAPVLGAANIGGGMVVAYGPTNGGKSTIGKFAFSAFGNPDRQQDSPADTTNYRAAKMQLFGSIPLYLDEATSIPVEEISSFAYQVSGGVGKGRLSSASKMQPKGNWSTIVLASSNQSIHERIASNRTTDRATKVAQMMRVFEFYQPQFDGVREFGRAVHAVMARNYGVAADAFLRWCVARGKDQLRDDLMAAKEAVDAAVGFRDEERFWSFLTAAALVGGGAARELGLIVPDPESALDWIGESVVAMRVGVRQIETAAQSLLAQFVSENALSVVAADDKGVVRAPIRDVVMRYDISKGELSIMRSKLVEFVARNGANYHKLKAELERRDALVDHDAKVTLTKGIASAPPLRADCWVVDVGNLDDVGDILNAATAAQAG